MIKTRNCILILSIFLQIISLGFEDVIAANVIPVPPFKTNKESILKMLSLENITIDLPALYVFGDSFVDAGNNIYYTKLERRNYTPYGIDFDGKPTGRYTNGRTVADFIAQIVGLPFPPPVLSFSNKNKSIPQTGLNYASGFTGIFDTFNPCPIAIRSLRQQVDMFENTTKELQSQFGSEERFSTYLSKSLFFINTGEFELNAAWNGWNYFYDEVYFTKLLVKFFATSLKRLYQFGARKIIINNMCPIGCEPNKNSDGKCSDEANNRALLYNRRLSNLLKDLQSTLPGSKFVLVDLYKIFEDVYASPTSYGFLDTKGNCCNKLNNKNYGRPCLANAAPCKDRNTYVFFDPYNPTESMHFIWARRMLNDTSVTYPTNLIQLIQS